MIDMNALRAVIVKGLREHLGIPVIRSNQTGEPPAYPYCSYTITTLMSANNGTWGEYEDGKDRKPTTQTWSVTIQSDDVAEAMNLTIKAHEWFEHTGRSYLNDNRVIVQSVGGINNRDNLITIEYEYRNGFDVVFWMLSEVDDPSDKVGYIESVELNGEVYEKGPTIEELAEKLERRLDGEVV